MKKLRSFGLFPFWKVANKWFYHCKHRLHHTCTSILIQFRGAFLCPKASETAWILKSNRSLGRVQKQKNRLRFPSESVFCSRKRFFVGKNAPKIFWNAPAFKTKKNRRTCEDIRKIRRFVLPLDFSSVYELKNHFPIMEHRHFFYRCSPQLLIKAVQHLRNSRDGFQEVM